MLHTRAFLLRGCVKEVFRYIFLNKRLSLRASATSEAICQALADVIARHEATSFFSRKLNNCLKFC